MAIEAIKGAAMTYQGSVSTAEVREAARPKAETSEIINVSESISRNTVSLNTKEASGDGSGEGANQQQNQEPQSSSINFRHP